MMPKKLAMALMMALRIPAIPLTTAMMQLPMVWKRDLICCLGQQERKAEQVTGGDRLTHDTTAPIVKMLRGAT